LPKNKNFIVLSFFALKNPATKKGQRKGWPSVTPHCYSNGAPSYYLDGGLATAGLLATGAQTDVQNVPVDLQLMAPKLAETLG